MNNPLLESYETGDRPVLWLWERLLKKTFPIWERRMSAEVTVRVQILGVQIHIPESQWPSGKNRQILFCRILLRRAGLDPALAREMRDVVEKKLRK